MAFDKTEFHATDSAPQADVMIQDGITFDARRLCLLRRIARVALDAHVLPALWHKEAQEMSAAF